MRAEQHAVLAGDEPLRVVGRVPADHADGVGLGDVLGDRQQLRHRLERLAQVILVEPGDDHAHAAIGQRAAHRGQILVEELPFVDADDFGLRLDRVQQLTRSFDGARLDPHLAVRHDVVVGIARVDGRLEDLDFLAGDARAAQTADQLLALAAEHAADDDFNPTLDGLSDNVHRSRKPESHV